MPHRHLLLAGDAVEPGGGIGGAVGLREAHLRGRAGDLSVEVGLGHGLLLLLQGLLDQRPRHQHLHHVAAVPFEANRLHLLERHRLAVDEGGHSGPGTRLRRIVHDVFDGGCILKFLEDLARCLAALPLAQLLGQVRPDLVELRARRRQVAFALDHNELVGHLDDLGDSPVLEREGGAVELRIARVQPDWLHPAVGAGAADVDGMLAGEGSELVGGGKGLGPNRFGLLPCAAGDDPRLHGRAEPVFEGLLEFLGRRLNGAAGEAAEREHRPDDIVGVLLGRDPALLLDHLQPLVARHAEPPGHRVDFGTHVLRRDRGALPLAGLLDDAPVDECLQHAAAVAPKTLRRELIGGDVDPVDDRDRLGSRGHRSGS